MITAQPEGLEQISLDLKKSAEILEDITGQIMRLAGEMLDDFQIEEISGNPEIKSMVVSVNNDTARSSPAIPNCLKNTIRRLMNGVRKFGLSRAVLPQAAAPKILTVTIRCALMPVRICRIFPND